MNTEQIHWLQHCLCWFGFHEPAKFVHHKDGGYFASVATGLEIESVFEEWAQESGEGVAMNSQNHRNGCNNRPQFVAAYKSTNGRQWIPTFVWK